MERVEIRCQAPEALPQIRVVWQAVGQHRDRPGAGALGSTPASIRHELHVIEVVIQALCGIVSSCVK